MNVLGILDWTGNTIAGAAVKPAGPAAVPRPDPGAASHTRFLHLTEQGATLRRAGNRLRITRKAAVLRDIPAMKLQGVLCYGNVQVTSQCLRALLEEGVWLAFLTRQGRYCGRLQPPAESGGPLRARQWLLTRDLDYCLAFARSIIASKILGARRLAALQSKRNLAESLGDGAIQLRESVDAALAAPSLDVLRGVEGSAARAYFELFRRWNRSDLPFESREKRGAASPVNALLNLAYSLLTQELNGLLEASGLDPAAGFYHQLDPGRPSLACDWVEEFRHVVADRFVLRLLNYGGIQAKDFHDLGERGIRLQPDALRRVLSVWEHNLLGKDTGEPGEATGWRAIFLSQLERLTRSIATGEPYQPHRTRED